MFLNERHICTFQVPSLLDHVDLFSPMPASGLAPSTADSITVSTTAATSQTVTVNEKVGDWV